MSLPCQAMGSHWTDHPSNLTDWLAVPRRQAIYGKLFFVPSALLDLRKKISNAALCLISFLISRRLFFSANGPPGSRDRAIVVRSCQKNFISLAPAGSAALEAPVHDSEPHKRLLHWRKIGNLPCNWSFLDDHLYSQKSTVAYSQQLRP